MIKQNAHARITLILTIIGDSIIRHLVLNSGKAKYVKREKI